MPLSCLVLPVKITVGHLKKTILPIFKENLSIIKHLGFWKSKASCQRSSSLPLSKLWHDWWNRQQGDETHWWYVWICHTIFIASSGEQSLSITKLHFREIQFSEKWTETYLWKMSSSGKILTEFCAQIQYVFFCANWK